MEDKRFCSQCGADLGDEAKFCATCGAKVEETSEQEGKQVPQSDAVEELKSETDQENSRLSNADSTGNYKKIKEKSAKATAATQETANKIAEKVSEKTGKKIKGKHILVSVIILLVVIVCGSFIFVKSQPKNILNNTKVKFSGYNTLGNAMLEDEYYKEESALIAKKVGYSSSDIDAVRKGNTNVLDSDTAKYLQFEKYLEDTSVKLDKYVNLKNGDKVTVSVNTSLEDNPIKETKKTFVVKGLKKTTTFNADSLMKDHKVSASGYNHFGKLDYDSDYYEVNNDESLSNGDKVILTINSEYIASQKEKGNLFNGKNSKEITISGLEDSAKISNLDELLKQEDAVVNSEHKDSTGFFEEDYTVTRMTSYFIGKDVNGYSYEENSDEDAAEFSVLTVYKIDSKTDSGTDTEYKIYWYSGLRTSNEKVNVAALTDGQKYDTYSSYTSEKEAINDLKADYPSLVKVG